MSPESCWLFEGVVLGDAPEIPLLLHECRVHRTWGDTVDTDLSVAVFERCGFTEGNDAVLARVVGGMSRES